MERQSVKCVADCRFWRFLYIFSGKCEIVKSSKWKKENELTFTAFWLSPLFEPNSFKVAQNSHSRKGSSKTLVISTKTWMKDKQEATFPLASHADVLRLVTRSSPPKSKKTKTVSETTSNPVCFIWESPPPPGQAWHERKSGRKIRKNIYVLHNLLTPNTLASHNSALIKIWCLTQILSEEKAREAFPNPKLTPPPWQA